MKEYTAKEFASAVPCSVATLANWRKGNIFTADHTNDSGYFVYTEEQLPAARALLAARKTKTAKETKADSETERADTAPAEAEHSRFRKDELETEFELGDLKERFDKANKVVRYRINKNGTQCWQIYGTKIVDNNKGKQKTGWFNVKPAEVNNVLAQTSGITLVDFLNIEEFLNNRAVTQIENTETAAVMHAPPADVQPENADETEGVLGKKIMLEAPASSQQTSQNSHGNDSTNGGITQHLKCIPAEIQTRTIEAERFFDVLFGNVQGEVYSYLWTKQDKATYPFKVSDTDIRKDMARRAITLSDEGKDVYIGVNCSATQAQAGQRYTATQVTLQTATVTDIDVEGGNHSSTANKIYPPNFAVAKNFLPFAVSFLVDSGYGGHGYCVYSEPINITADNRAACETRNRKFIEAVRRRAGVFSKAVDSVGDLPRILRVPGTYNYKCGKDNAPLCKLVEVNDIRFTPATLDEQLAALETKPVSIQLATPKPARLTDIDYSDDSPEFKDFRIRRMLPYISVVKGEYDKWYRVGMGLYNEGFTCADWEQWSRTQPEFKEGECEKKWAGFKHKNEGIKIGTLHEWAKEGGYSETETYREWHDMRGDRKTARRPNNDEPARADDGNTEWHDLQHDYLFSGNGSDLTFAGRLEKFCGDRVRWLTDSERWLVFSGGYWQRNSDKNSAIVPFARDMATVMNQLAQDKDERELAAKFQSAKKIGSAIGLLKAFDSVRITQDDLDRHPNLLCVQNGVVDLETATLMDADPVLLITQQCNCAFAPNAQAPLVEKFFKAIQPDEETRAGLLRWLGYCLTGETSEEKFAIWTGERGANGKGTLGGTLIELLGTYATGLAPRALLKNSRPSDANSATVSLNSLENTRFALSEEMPQNGEMDTSLVKNLTGGDRINLRRNYGEYRTIRATAKINLSGNFAPRIENINDGGILRRMINFAFNVRFGTDEHPADPALKKKLILPENLRGLLAILVREAVTWYKGGGLIISPLMIAETARHLAQNDFVADFIDDYYVKNTNAQVKVKEFIEHLKREYPRETARFKRADLVKLVEAQDGVTYGKDNHNANIFKGIGKAARDNDLDGEPVGKDVATPY